MGETYEKSAKISFYHVRTLHTTYTYTLLTTDAQKIQINQAEV